MEHHIPRGLMEYRGEKVDFASVKGMRVLTVEGANDHLCPPGQTEAAHGISRGSRRKISTTTSREDLGTTVSSPDRSSPLESSRKFEPISKAKCRLWGRKATVRS